MQIKKNKPVRDPKYLKAISGYGCVITGQAAIPHHLKGGYKQGGGKVSDHLTFPLSDKYHSATYETGLHKDWQKWENEHGMQTSHIRMTLNTAVNDGFISYKDYCIAVLQCIDLAERFR